MDFRKEELTGRSYGELISIRRQLQKEIDMYEYDKSRGLPFKGGPMKEKEAADEYKTKILFLSELSAFMADIYDPAKPIVDETDEDAMLMFAQGVIWGDETSDIDLENLELAMRYLLMLAKHDNAEAMNKLGAMYFEGRGVEQDYTTAAQWYVNAADRGCSLAMSNAGYCFYYGNGVDVDYEKAYLYFSKAAMLGEWDAINKFGDMYRDGKYVKEDKKTAFEIYTRGNEVIPHESRVDAYPENLLRIGECLLKGWGCDVDLNVAELLLKEAIHLFEIQVNNGRIYAKSGLSRAAKLYEAIRKEV